MSGLGQAGITPGVLFNDADDVVPDVAWISLGRLKTMMDDAGHLTGAPELVVEVLSPGAQNERRDRQAKRKLYELSNVERPWCAFLPDLTLPATADRPAAPGGRREDWPPCSPTGQKR